jgi:DNA-binding MarR family transcriptional regulator
VLTIFAIDRIVRGGMAEDRIALLPLIGAAQRTYNRIIRDALADAGLADLPPGAYRMTGLLARGDSSLQDLADRLDISKQAASRMIELLVERGYYTKEPDRADRRRVNVSLAQAGVAAGKVILGAISRVDAALRSTVDLNDVLTTRATLHSLIAAGRDLRASRAPRRPAANVDTDC